MTDFDVDYPDLSKLPPHPYGSASWQTLVRRFCYGGRKGDRAGTLLNRAGFFQLCTNAATAATARIRAEGNQ